MKKLHDIRWCARRYLCAMKSGTTDVRVYLGYIPFDEGHPPSWWTDEHASRTDIPQVSYEKGDRPSWWTDDLASSAWGTVLGVHEDVDGSPVGAFIVTEKGLAVLDERLEAVWAPYTDITGWYQLSKDAVSLSLRLKTKSGDVDIPFHHRTPGTAFAFVQFLGAADRWCDRESTRGAKS